MTSNINNNNMLSDDPTAQRQSVDFVNSPINASSYDEMLQVHPHDVQNEIVSPRPRLGIDTSSSSSHSIDDPPADGFVYYHSTSTTSTGKNSDEWSDDSSVESSTDVRHPETLSEKFDRVCKEVEDNPDITGVQVPDPSADRGERISVLDHLKRTAQSWLAKKRDVPLIERYKQLSASCESWTSHAEVQAAFDKLDVPFNLELNSHLEYVNTTKCKSIFLHYLAHLECHFPLSFGEYRNPNGKHWILKTLSSQLESIGISPLCLIPGDYVPAAQYLIDAKYEYLCDIYTQYFYFDHESVERYFLVDNPTKDLAPSTIITNGTRLPIVVNGQAFFATRGFVPSVWGLDRRIVSIARADDKYPLRFHPEHNILYADPFADIKWRTQKSLDILDDAYSAYLIAGLFLVFCFLPMWMFILPVSLTVWRVAKLVRRMSDRIYDVGDWVSLGAATACAILAVYYYAQWCYTQRKNRFKPVEHHAIRVPKLSTANNIIKLVDAVGRITGINQLSFVALLTTVFTTGAALINDNELSMFLTDVVQEIAKQWKVRDQHVHTAVRNAREFFSNNKTYIVVGGVVAAIVVFFYWQFRRTYDTKLEKHAKKNFNRNKRTSTYLAQHEDDRKDYEFYDDDEQSRRPTGVQNFFANRNVTQRPQSEVQQANSRIKHFVQGVRDMTDSAFQQWAALKSKGQMSINGLLQYGTFTVNRKKLTKTYVVDSSNKHAVARELAIWLREGPITIQRGGDNTLYTVNPTEDNQHELQRFMEVQKHGLIIRNLVRDNDKEQARQFADLQNKMKDTKTLAEKQASYEEARQRIGIEAHAELRFENASKHIVKIDDYMLGQGFFVKDHLITAAHIVSELDVGDQLYVDGEIRTIKSIAIRDHDVANIQFKETPHRPQLKTYASKSRGTCYALVERDGKQVIEAGTYSVSDGYAFYTMELRQGDSGSPIFDEHNALVAMHSGAIGGVCFGVQPKHFFSDNHVILNAFPKGLALHSAPGQFFRSS